jgi:hypothetical protein
MKLTEDVMNKLFGGPDALEDRLKRFVDWFEGPDGFVKLSDTLSNVIAPAFIKIGHAAQTMWDVMKKGLADLKQDSQFLHSDDKWGEIWDRDKTFSQNMNTWGDAAGLNLSKDELIGKAAAAARKHGAAIGLSGPDLNKAVSEFQGLIDQETGGKWNPNAQNPRTGAFGLGQVLPKNWPAGRDGGDPDTQLDVAAGIFFGNLKRRQGDYAEAGRDYYGRGKTPPGEPTTDQYIQQWQNRVPKFEGGATYQPQSYRSGDGGHTITVYVSHANATGEEIGHAVARAIDRREREHGMNDYATVQGAFA